MLALVVLIFGYVWTTSVIHFTNLDFMEEWEEVENRR